MKPNVIFLSLLLFAPVLSQAQTDLPGSTTPSTVPSTLPSTMPSLIRNRDFRIGLRLAANVCTNSANNEGGVSATSFDNNRSGIRLSGGLVTEFFFDDRYAFSSGLWYTVKRAAYRTNAGRESEYNIQYLQIPVTLKLYTNEVYPDTRVYFQLGGTFDIKLNERSLDRRNDFMYAWADAGGNKVFKPINVGLILGVGAEMEISETNAIFAGLVLNRGLINMMGTVRDGQGTRISDVLRSTNTLIGLEAGLKF